METRRAITLIIMLSALSANAQTTYSEIVKKAAKTVNTEDSVRYQDALDSLEKAFKAYPDSINGNGLYYASRLASELKNRDKAFVYLTPLAHLETDEEGYPGWSFVADEYAKEDYKNILNDPRWDTLEASALVDKKKYLEKLNVAQRAFFNAKEINLNDIADAKALYQAIQSYHPYREKAQQDYSLSFSINDSTKTSYLVHLPPNYNPQREYPALIFLHGAVRYSSLAEYQVASARLGGWNRFYTKYAELTYRFM